jgi:hypothetical protein
MQGVASFFRQFVRGLFQARWPGNKAPGYKSNAQFFAAHCRAVSIEDV